MIYNVRSNKLWVQLYAGDTGRPGTVVVNLETSIALGLGFEFPGGEFLSCNTTRVFVDRGPRR